ncbi:MAG: transcription termination factor NusA [Treponema sp.]|nr:transcription termination factor NusA [Treponema sp.]
MGIDMSDVIRQLSQERGLSEELIQKTIEDMLLAAYRKRFGTDENAIIRFDDDKQVSILSRKKVVEHDDVYNPVDEIDLLDARELNPDADVGDEILVIIDAKEFNRQSVQLAKQTAHQSIREIQKDSLYSEYKDKVGEIIIGYYQRERNGTIYVDLGKIEGILPKKYQSSRETYHLNDRIKALIKEVNKSPSGLQIVLSRTDPDFVRAIFELEVPEVYDKTVEIHKIVREAGYRTKLAVYSNRDDVDPVGACVGLKGVRIQAVIKELEGEKIDILKYDPDPRRFIKNALSPAEVRDVIILSEKSKKALAVVSDSLLSLAIGKQGLNVRLANKLTDWMIDVKTDAQFAEMDIAAESRRAVSELFGDTEDEELSRISELPGVDGAVAQALLDNGIDYIADFLDLDQEQLDAMENISPEQIDTLRALIDESVEIVEEEEETVFEGEEFEGEEAAEEADETAEEVECPECHVKFTLDMAGESGGTISCPNCGAELELSYEKEEEEQEE